MQKVGQNARYFDASIENETRNQIYIVRSIISNLTRIVLILRRDFSLFWKT